MDSDEQANPWDKFLCKIKESVDDALVVYKGDDDINSCGIYAQVKDKNEPYTIKLWPSHLELKQWINYFEDINEKKHPKSKLDCTFQRSDTITQKFSFHIIEYSENFIRTHLVEDDIRKSLFLSQTKDFIFVGYCSTPNKIQTPSQTFCAIESLARFVRDCEIYQKMEPINNK